MPKSQPALGIGIIIAATIKPEPKKTMAGHPNGAPSKTVQNPQAVNRTPFRKNGATSFQNGYSGTGPGNRDRITSALAIDG